MNRKGVLARLGVLTTIAAALVLMLAACGTSTSLGETPTTAGGGEGSGGGGGGGSTITVTETEFSITPSDVSAPAGNITFQIKNTGAVAHDIAVMVNGTEHASPLVDPGKSETWSVTISDAGTYDMYCSVPGHKAAGMNGTLKVTAP